MLSLEILSLATNIRLLKIRTVIFLFILWVYIHDIHKVTTNCISL